jgi:hypothetical protein
MWMATNSGTFSVAYNDGRFKAQGSFSSAGNFGEMGTERNGSFVRHEDEDESEHGKVAAGTVLALPQQLANSPKFKGKVPVEVLIH